MDYNGIVYNAYENIKKLDKIIEEAQKAYLTSLRDQVETPLDTSHFAPSVVGKTALDQAERIASILSWPCSISLGRG